MEIYTLQLVLFMMLFVRISALVITAPIVGNQAVPIQVKIALSLFLALVLYPMVASHAPNVDLSLGGLALLAIKEVCVGLILGFVTGLIFDGVLLAGELIGFDMGISIASAIDPENGRTNPVIGVFLSMVMMLVFLSINGHHFVFQALYLSYEAVPVGSFTISAISVDRMVAITGVVFAVGIKLAAPVMVASFMVNIALGILVRVAPQMNVFIVSMPLKIGMGLIVLMVSAPMMVYVFKKLLEGFENNVLELVKAM